jgi:hypothetical protein
MRSAVSGSFRTGPKAVAATQAAAADHRQDEAQICECSIATAMQKACSAAFGCRSGRITRSGSTFSPAAYWRFARMDGSLEKKLLELFFSCWKYLFHT